MSKKTSRFGANVTADVERRKREGSSYGYLKLPQNVNVFKESEGKVKVDIIPYIVTDENHMDGNPKYPDAANPGNPWYKKPILVHRSVGAENQSIICPKTQGKKCPICEQRAKQQSQGLEKDDPTLIQKPQTRILYVVIPIENKNYEEKFHIWDISYGNFQKQLDQELGENPDAGKFPDPSDGSTLEIRFSEETFNKNKYFEANRIDFKKREGYEDDVMDKAPNLDEAVTILSYKEIEKMFLELDEDEEEETPKFKKKVAAEEEEDELPRKKKTITEESSPFRKKKAAEPEPEEEEEEEAPKKKVSENPFKRSPAKKVEPEPEEEEEEEAPAPKRKSLPKEEEAPKKKVAEPSAGVCPAKLKFGKDWDGFDACDDCPKATFKACGTAHENSK